MGGSAKRHGIFLSYARKDGEIFAARLRELLRERAPDIRILQDRLLLEGGRGWRQQIHDAIDSVSFLVLVMTPAAAISEEVRAEWDYARTRGVCVYPVKGVSDSDLRFDQMPGWMSKVHFFDIDREWESFVGHLRMPCQVHRAVFAAPDAPATFVMRPVEFRKVKNFLLLSRTIQLVGATAVLSGPGGSGKSTLAQAICADNEIRRHFDDGILWIDLGPDPKILNALATLYAMLTGERPAFTGEEDPILHVAQKLERRSCLVVIDDIWDSAHLKPLIHATKGSTRLVTTQISQVADWNCGELFAVSVDVMTPEESVELLGSGLPDVDTGELKKLARQLGGWAVALDIAAATMRRRFAQGEGLADALAHMLQRLSAKGVSSLKKRTAESRHRTITETLNLAFELLQTDNQRRLKELSVFPEGFEIPLSAIGLLWGLDDPSDIEEVAEELAEFSLLRLDMGRQSIRLHDVIRRWLGEQVKNPGRLHNRLVHGWKDWLDLPESYAWRWLPWHLAQAGRGSDLYKLARTEQFLALQQERLREQPYAALTTIQTALAYAAEKREIAVLAEMVLRHAGHFEHLSQQSPLDVFRAGEGAQAFELAAGFEVERKILWFLLLAWEAKECNRAADLRTVLERLGDSRPFLRLKARQSRLAADFLANALDPGAELFEELRKQSLNSSGIFDLSLAMALTRPLLALAPGVAAQIRPALDRARALVRIGSQQALRGQNAKARDTFIAAIEAVRANQFEDPDDVDDIDDWGDDDYSVSSWGRTGEEIVLGEIAVAQAKAGDLASALETVSGVDGGEADRALTAMAQEQTRRGEWKEAAVILDRISSDEGRVPTLLSLAGAQIQAGMREAGSEAMEKAVAIARKSKSFERYRLEIALAQGRVGALDQAHKLVGRMKAGVTQVVARARLAALEGAAGQRAFRSALESLSMQPDGNEALYHLAIDLAEGLDFQNGLAVAQLIDVASGRVDALKTIARAQVTAGFDQEARETLSSAVQIAATDAEGVDVSHTMRELARIQVEAGDMASARATYARAILESRGYRGGLDSNLQGRGEALAGVAIAHAESGRAPTGVRTLKHVDSSRRDITLGGIAKAQAHQGDLKGALKTASQIEDKYDWCVALIRIATVLFKKGESEIVTAILEAAYKVGLQITKFSIRALAVSQVGSTLLLCNQTELGLLVLEHAAVFASSIESGASSEDPDDGQEILRDIAVEQARAGDRNAAMATLKHIYIQSLYDEAAREIESPKQPAAGAQREAARSREVPKLAGERLDEKALQSAWLARSAYRFCGELARSFPDYAGAIEKIVLAADKR